MAGTVVGVFKDKVQAERAAQALLDDGVPLEDITLVRKDAGGETGAPDIEGNAPVERDEAFLSEAVREVPIHDVEQPMNTVDEALPRAVTGIVIGASVASMFMAAAIYLPSAEGLLRAYPLQAELGAGVLGGLIGALVGALTGGGIPAEAARIYQAHVQRGDTLVTALASSSNAPHMQEILREHGGRRLGFYRRFIDTIQSLESVPSHSRTS